MSNKIIAEGKNTPKVELDGDSRKIVMFGKSFPENSKRFYKPIEEWLEKQLAVSDAPFDIDLTFYYISSSSIISVLEILRLCAEKGSSASTISWNYEADDEDVRKIGEDYQRVVNLQFTLNPV